MIFSKYIKENKTQKYNPYEKHPPSPTILQSYTYEMDGFMRLREPEFAQYVDHTSCIICSDSRLTMSSPVHEFPALATRKQGDNVLCAAHKSPISSHLFLFVNQSTGILIVCIRSLSTFHLSLFLRDKLILGMLNQLPRVSRLRTGPGRS